MSNPRPSAVEVYYKLRTEQLSALKLGTTMDKPDLDTDSGLAGIQNQSEFEVPFDPAAEKYDLFYRSVNELGAGEVIDIKNTIFRATLSAAINAVVTSFAINDPGFVDAFRPGDPIRIEDEDLLVQSYTSGTFTIVAEGRGAHGTVAASHPLGADVILMHFTVPHNSLVLAGDVATLAPPTLALQQITNGFNLTITPPSDPDGRLFGYQIFRGTASPATTFLRFVSARGGDAVIVEDIVGSGFTTTYFYRVKSITISGVLSTTFSNEVSGIPGKLPSLLLQEGALDFSTTITFSADSNTQVSWTSGTIAFSNGTVSGTIVAGNTGAMTALTHIFYDSAVSTTALQVATSFVAADTKRLLAVAQNIADVNQRAFFVPSIGVFGINETVIGPRSISTGKVQAGAITANEVFANTITSAQITTAALTGLLIETTSGGKIRTAASGARVELDSVNGFMTFDSAGNTRVQIPTNYSEIRFNVSDTIPGKITFGSAMEIFTKATGTTLVIVPTTNNTSACEIGNLTTAWSRLDLTAGLAGISIRSIDTSTQISKGSLKVADNSVILSTGGVIRFEVSSASIVASFPFIPNADTGQNLGSSTFRWATTFSSTVECSTIQSAGTSVFINDDLDVGTKQIFSGTHLPQTDNSFNLGSALFRWSELRAVTIFGAGSNITSLNASNVASGTLADARLSSNVPLKNVTNTFSVAQIINGGVDDTVNGLFDIKASGNLAGRFLSDANILDNSTALGLRTKKAGVLSSDTVSLGAADSGGAGFRLLRVPN